MAIDVFKRQGKSAVTGLLGKNLRRIAGNVGSVIRGEIGSESSETAPINRTKQSTKMLSFPIDVGADPGIGNHGHYVMFFINEQVNAKLKFGEEAENSGGGGTGGSGLVILRYPNTFSITLAGGAASAAGEQSGTNNEKYIEIQSSGTVSWA